MGMQKCTAKDAQMQCAGKFNSYQNHTSGAEGLK